MRLPRPKVRLSGLALIILVAALAFALVAEWQREAELRAELAASRQQTKEAQAVAADAIRAAQRAGARQ